MILEVRGTNTVNKGAELMLRAILAELQPEHTIAVTPDAGSYAERSALGVHHKLGSRRLDRRVPRGVLLSGSRLVPRRASAWAQRDFGLVLERSVGAFLDASGFAYSDQFDQERSAITADIAKYARRTGRPYVLLPQAFGPFKEPERCATFLEIAEHSELVFARERSSFDHCVAAGCPPEKLRLSPDFTCLLDGVLPAGYVAPPNLALVVPSAKMLTHAAPSVRATYVDFMAGCVGTLRDAGFEVRVLVHERGDTDICAAVAKAATPEAPVLSSHDPLELKGIIGSARLVAGSRFHALVSALSQGVPVAAIGWSHKYAELLTDYGIESFLLDPAAGGGSDSPTLQDVIAASAQAELRPRLLERAAGIKSASKEMWAEVRAVLSASHSRG